MSDQLENRTDLIKFMQNFAFANKMEISTVHLASTILDIYMNDYTLSQEDEHQKFIALVALLLAAKSRDIEDRIPSIKSILYVVDLSSELGVDVRFSTSIDDNEMKKVHQQFLYLYCQIEFMIFECCHFNTSYRPTAVNFVQIFQNKIVTKDDLMDLHSTEKIITFSELRRMANDFCKQLLNDVLYNVELTNLLLPSKVAAAVAASMRQMIGIKTVWNLQLQLCFRSTLEEILPIVTILLTPKMKTNNDSTCGEAEEDKRDVSVDEEEDSGFVDESMSIIESCV